jgi:CheY-like chemotaxis protein
MMLPKVSGLDVLRALKGDVLVKHIPVIVLSGLGQGNETKLVKEGAAAFFMKSEKSFDNSSSARIQAVESGANSKQQYSTHDFLARYRGYHREWLAAAIVAKQRRNKGINIGD